MNEAASQEPNQTPDEGDFVYPVSFVQQRLWFLDQLEPNNPAYNAPLLLELKGRLSIEVLQQSINALARRHESLRTGFQQIDDEPMQVIVDVDVAIEVVDLSDDPCESRRQAAEQCIRDESLKPFDLAKPPLMRCKLLRLEADSHLLVLVFHHIIVDGWSMGILMRDLFTIYDAFANDRQPDLPKLPIQYIDFAAWQRERLRGERLEKLMRYWRDQLDGSTARLELPIDRPRPAVQSFDGDDVSCALDETLTAAVTQFCRDENTSLFMALLAAIKTLLHRYTGQTDIAVGTGHANRNRVEIEDVVGCFVNTLVMRTDLAGSLSFRDVLSRVREVSFDAFEHQEIPFEKLVVELETQRDLSSSPLFNVAFVLQNWPRPQLDVQGLQVERFRVASLTSKFDLTLNAEINQGEIQLRAEYNTDLFDRRTIARMLEHLKMILESGIADPDRAISQLPLLTPEELRQVTESPNKTDVAYPAVCMHELFESQAASTPNAVAVICGEDQLTYHELNHRADRLADQLRSLGVELEQPVGVCVSRSVEMVVGLLGILKAGAAYVPMDREFPDQRLRLMIEDARIQHIVTQASITDRLSSLPADLVVIDATSKSTSQLQSFNRLQEHPSSSNLAYIIYTSGSSGQPKGVAIEHRQLVNYVLGVIDRLQLQAGWQFATVSTIAADLGNTMIFPSLCCGGCLHVMSKEDVTDSKRFANYFLRHKINCLKITPSHLSALMDDTHAAQVLPQHRLVLGGESSRADFVSEVRRHAPNCRIFNHYGPTETTVGVTTFEVGTHLPTTVSQTVPIGRPLPNSKVYVLDEQMQPTPIGVTGQLCIGGAGLARGYLNRQELTREKFVPNPWGKEGARLYQTGDYARMLADGNIEFLGRRDHQVKVRGYRVELGEIEAAIRQYPAVNDSVVVIKTDESGNNRLAAYVVPHPSATRFGKLSTYKLPNGETIAHLNKSETDYIYREIFELQAYLRHGITIEDGSCIFDVGANVGLFSVFASRICNGAKIYSFEPNPKVFEILKANLDTFCPPATPLNCGLSTEERTADLTFFQGFSLLSGYYADVEQERDVVKTFLCNQDEKELARHADELLDGRFDATSVQTELRSLSSVIAEQGIERIDLLKINVEKSELDVLRGIQEGDWPKIQQIVLEVDVAENLPEIKNLLETHGFEFVVSQDQLLQQTELCYVYAIRRAGSRALLRDQAPDAHLREIESRPMPTMTAKELHQHLSQRLPTYMVPAAIELLAEMPLTANGKVDRQALAQRQTTTDQQQYTFVAPRTPVEKTMAEIWSELLGVKRVGVEDDFFELGGHSLMAIQCVSRIRTKLSIDLQVRSIFESPTLQSLAKKIELHEPSFKQPDSIPRVRRTRFIEN